MRIRKVTLILLCLFSITTGFFLAVQIQTPGKVQKLYVSSKTLSDLNGNIQGELKNGENLRQRLEEEGVQI